MFSVLFEVQPSAAGIVAWDVFDAVLAPGDAIVLVAWRTVGNAQAFEDRLALPAGTRLRRVRVVRDYGMFDRREAPQYYPDARPGWSRRQDGSAPIRRRSARH